MIVGGRHIHPASGPGQGARRDSGFSESVTFELSVPGLVPFGDYFAAIDHHVVAQGVALDRFGVLREQQIGDDCHRQLVFLRQVVRFGRRVITIGGVGRRDNYARVIALRRAVDLIEVGLFRLGRDAGRRAAALDFDDHDRGFDHPGHPDGFGHQREAAARGAAHRANTGVSRADGHVHDGQFVFTLLDHYAAFRAMIGHPMQDRRGGGHRVGRIEFAPGGDRAEREEFVAGHERTPHAREVPLVAERDDFLSGVFVTGAHDVDVLVNYLLTLVLESVGEHFRRHIEFQVEQEEHRAHRHGVLHYRREFAKRFEQLGDGHRRGQYVIAREPGRDFELVGVVYDRAARIDFAGVSFDRILIQRDQDIEVIAVRVDLLFTGAHAQPDVAAANHRLIAVVSAQVKPKTAAGFGDGVARLVQSVSGGAGDADSDLFTLVHRWLLRKHPSSDEFIRHVTNKFVTTWRVFIYGSSENIQVVTNKFVTT